MPARAHAGDAHALREVAIGKAHPRAAKAALGGLFEVETRLERHALERRANCLASNPERSRRQRYRACRSRAAELDGPDHRAVTIDAAGAARAIETIKREKLAGYEVLGCSLPNSPSLSVSTCTSGSRRNRSSWSDHRRATQNKQQHSSPRTQWGTGRRSNLTLRRARKWRIATSGRRLNRGERPAYSGRSREIGGWSRRTWPPGSASTDRPRNRFRGCAPRRPSSQKRSPRPPEWPGARDLP